MAGNQEGLTFRPTWPRFFASRGSIGGVMSQAPERSKTDGQQTATGMTLRLTRDYHRTAG